jgi:hypothetical protein
MQASFVTPPLALLRAWRVYLEDLEALAAREDAAAELPYRQMPPQALLGTALYAATTGIHPPRAPQEEGGRRHDRRQSMPHNDRACHRPC